MTMRAAVFTHYGPPDVVSIVERPLPTPGRGEVLIRVRAVAVTAGDARIRASAFPWGMYYIGRMIFGISGPRSKFQVLGGSVSGQVAAVGAGVDLAVGDDVVTVAVVGGHAEYIVLPAKEVVRKPQLSDEDAAGIAWPACPAVTFLRSAGIAIGEGTPEIRLNILLNGATGAVGSLMLQLAVLAGHNVTGVASGANRELVEQLGAAHIDYSTTKVTDLVPQYDVVIDTVGNLTASEGLALCVPGGKVLLLAADLSQMLPRKNVYAMPVGSNPDDIAAVLRLAADRKIKPLTNALPFEEIVKAHEIVSSGRKVGNLVVTMKW